MVNPEGGEFCKTMFYPAVVYPVTEGMRLYREEQFGPVVPVAVYDDIETVLDYVTTSDHGQQVSILVVTQRKLVIWSIHLYIKFVV